jgi:hypothetical protein
MTRNPRYAAINALEELAAYHHTRGDRCKHLARQLIETQGQPQEAALIDEAMHMLLTFAQSLPVEEAPAARPTL